MYWVLILEMRKGVGAITRGDGKRWVEVSDDVSRVPDMMIFRRKGA